MWLMGLENVWVMSNIGITNTPIIREVNYDSNDPCSSYIGPLTSVFSCSLKVASYPPSLLAYTLIFLMLLATCVVLVNVNNIIFFYHFSVN